jgi:hypothetical protein
VSSMRFLLLISIFLMFAGIGPAKAQDIRLDYPPAEINIDSLIQDSLNKLFILNHKPLTAAERALVVFKKESTAYGEYVKYYLENIEWYSFAIPRVTLYATKKTHSNLEWIFYIFLFLFFFTAVLGKYSNGLLRKLWKIYINDGFIYRQSKDQMSQLPLFSIALNVLFIFSGGIFLFFGMDWDYQFTGNLRWYILLSSFAVIALIYLFKNIFLRILGWAFGQEEAFEDYLFVVFLNNKLMGLILLFASFLMAFSSSSSSIFIFKFTLFLIALMFIYRFLRGYQVFSRQSRIGLFSLLLAFISLELIPSAVVVKLLGKTIDLFVAGIL